ncbi:MAG: hypothetical protein Q4G05_01540 [Clostridia bacterium]|nr:hypothetical protein [Clostridia bacterium]
MADRDKYGNYVNDEGVTIKITTDKNGNDHISFYGGEVDKPHDAAHVNVNYDKESWSSTTHGPDKSDTSSGSGSCYLTSACMKYFQEKFDDNCYELTVLRWFRNNFVSKEDIEHYYEVAPIIVETINKEENSGIVYDYIYDNIVDYCVKQIEQGNYDAAYSRYKNSVLALEQQFAKPALINRLVKTLKLKTNN